MTFIKSKMIECLGIATTLTLYIGLRQAVFVHFRVHRSLAHWEVKTKHTLTKDKTHTDDPNDETHTDDRKL